MMTQTRQKKTWYLFDAIEDDRSKETALYYTDGEKIFAFRPHPTEAFCYYFIVMKGVTPNEGNELVNNWIENAIGPKAEYYDRILKFRA